MQFSIIIPVLNEAVSLPAQLQALQPLREISEIIAVDGGSRDGTVALAETWVDCVLHSPAGRAKQMNCGARRAEGDILIFLHADTLLPDKALDAVAQAVETTSPWGRFDIRLTGSHTMLTIVSRLMNLRSRLTGIATGDQTLFVERELFEKVGGFPDIALMEDIALSRTLKKYAFPACLSAKVVSSGRRWERYGVFKTIVLMWCLRLRYFLGENPERLAYLYSRGLFWKP
ncbi:MAG: TIGR04283 family arsenosugar biosynthesis glycosyltransferase [Gammaproteobacteria bacterium]